MKNTLRITAIASLLLFGSACQTVQNPATGEEQFTTISQEQEREIGRQQHPQVLAEFGGAYNDPQLQAYVDRVGRRLAQNAELPAEQFTFTVLDTPVVNAFALPGGYVYMTRGMMAVLNTEAELAGVLGHEIGHVTARHGATRQTRGLFANLAVIGAAVLTGSQEIAQLGQVAAQGYLASYSRDQESQSDSLGIRYLSRSGYDPQGMTDGLRALQRHGDLMARMSGQQAQQMSFFSTHPQTPERISATQREARAATIDGEARVGREAYLDALDGMIYGSSPAQGFVRGNRFSHPELRFTFTVPEGYRMDNLPHAVIASPSNGRDFIVFDQEPDRRTAASAGSMSGYISQRWAAEAQLSNLQRFTVDGMPAATAVAQATANGQPVSVRLVAIRYDAEHIYRFMFVAPRGSLNARSSENTINSFRRLSASEASQLQPLRIEVVRVQSGDTIQKLTRFDIQDGFEDDRFRVINGFDRGDGLRAGMDVKVIR
ncbi:MAG: M48 family metalloprotease [Minwuia sp.]|uniref:M48 family metalloprotease n=1 Tax=Minwuia sp. TaxID=2493630 RepID=UPI003A8B957C